MQYSDSAETYRRKELVHTLHHGSIEIGVMVFSAEIASNGLFMMASRILFSV